MKKSLFYIAVISAVLSSCAKEIELSPIENATNTSEFNKENVVIYGSVKPATKTTVDGTGIYSWQASETIAVVEQDMTDSEGTSFSLSDASTGAFTGTKTAGKNLVFAVSPAAALSAATEYGGLVEYTLTLPTTYSGYVAGTTNEVMVGIPDNDYTGEGYKFVFSHATALLKFTYANVPYGTKKFKLTTPENITGSWVVDATTGVSLSQSGASAKTVTITLASTVESVGQTMSFYVPVPAGNYSGFSIELQDAAGNTLSGTNKSKTSLDIDLAAGDILPCPTITLPAEALASLDYDDDDIADLITTKYDDPKNVVKSEGTWVVCAYKNSGMQLNTDKPAVSYITIPTLMGTITKIVITGTQPTRYYANSSNGSTSGGVQGENIDSKSYIDLSAKTWSTAHIVSSGAAVATHVDVVYTPKVVDHITVTTPPTKTTYSVGESIDLTGAVITATFTDATTQNVTSFVTTDAATVLAHAGVDKAVTVSFMGHTDSFTVTVTKGSAGLSFGSPSPSYNVAPNASFDEPELINPHDLTVHFSSTNSSLVAVDENTGEITIGSSTGGPVTITASTDGNDDYASGTAVYYVTVASIPSPETITITGTSSQTSTNGSVEFGGSGTSPAWNAGDNGVRCYPNNTITVSSTSYRIYQIDVTYKTNKNSKNVTPTSVSVNSGSLTTGYNSTAGGPYSMVWEKGASAPSSVVFTVNGSAGNIAIQSVKIYYE